MSLLGLLYVGLHFAFGATCGFGVLYGFGAQRKGPPYYKAWAVYVIAIAFCFGLLAGIYEIKHTQLLSDGYSWVGAAAIVIGFFVPIWKRSNGRK